MGPVRHDDLDRVWQVLEGVLWENAHASLGGRRCAVIDGPPYMGKTQAVLSFALKQSAEVWRNHEEKQDGTPRPIPWIYVEATPEGRGRALLREICQFAGIPVGRAETAADLKARLRLIGPKIGLQGIIIDDAHMLRGRGVELERLADTIKSCLTGIPATFVFVGVNMTESPLLARLDHSSAASEQVDLRAEKVLLEPWQPDKPGKPQRWARLAVTMAEQLSFASPDQCHLTQPEVLALLQRDADGRVGRAIDWIKTAANLAVRDNLPLDLDLLKATSPQRRGPTW